MDCIKHAQKGFTLVELLIAVVILSIGLLGIAGLQTKSLRYTQSAFFLSQATSLAYSLADRIQANPGGTYADTFYSAPIPTVSVSCWGSAATCSPDQMAVYDLNEWLTTVASALPDGDGQVTLDTSTNTYDIRIRWDDNRDGDNTDPEEQFTYSARIGG